jgi:hypothetical protein
VCQSKNKIEAAGRSSLDPLEAMDLDDSVFYWKLVKKIPLQLFIKRDMSGESQIFNVLTR